MSNFESEDLPVYAEALNALQDAEIDFLVGGAFAVYHYTNWWRNTHDVDVYVLPKDLARAKEALNSAGFQNLGEQAQGDDQWIYHAGKGSTIVDVLWRFANLVNYVQPDWFQRASRGPLVGLDVKFIPLEELMWIKVFVINRHRCDWPDLMRIIRAQCERIDWDKLLEHLGEHWLLLAGLIDVFDWQHPADRDCVPDGVRAYLAEHRRTHTYSQPLQDREQLLDPWIHLRSDRYASWRDEQSDDRPR